MVALVIMGTYIVALQSQDISIVAPAPPTIQRLPNQAPSQLPIKRSPDRDLRIDSPGPR